MSSQTGHHATIKYYSGCKETNFRWCSKATGTVIKVQPSDEQGAVRTGGQESLSKRSLTGFLQAHLL